MNFVLNPSNFCSFIHTNADMVLSGSRKFYCYDHKPLISIHFIELGGELKNVKDLSALSGSAHLLPNDLSCFHGNIVASTDDLVAIVCKRRILTTKWWSYI